MPEKRKDKTTWLKTAIAFLAVGVFVLAVLPMAHVGPAARVPLHVLPTLAEAGRAMGREMQASLEKSILFIGRDSPAASLLDKIDPLLSPAPLPGSRLPRTDAAQDGAGNSLFFAEVKDALHLPDLTDGAGRAAEQKVDLLVFHRYYLARNEEKQVAGTAVREAWSWESAPYVDHAALAAMDDAALRNNVIAAAASRGHAMSVELSTGAAPAFYHLSAALPWISPAPGHIPAGARLEKVLDLNKKKDVTAVYSISPNTGGAFLTKHAVPLHAAAEGDFPSGLEVWTTRAPEGGQGVSFRIVTVAQGRFNGSLSQEQKLDVPLRR